MRFFPRSVICGAMLTVLQVVATAHGHPKDQKAFPHSDALIVCQGAIGTKWTTAKGVEQLSYQVSVDYPATAVISCVSTALRETGWRPLRQDYWNPKLPSSRVRGWMHFVDTTVQPQATVDQWSGQWKSKTGEVVWYTLRYTYPPGDRRSLSVAAGLITADLTKK